MDTTTGARRLVRFVVRRDRVRIAVWIASIVALALQPVGVDSLAGEITVDQGRSLELEVARARLGHARIIDQQKPEVEQARPPARVWARWQRPRSGIRDQGSAISALAA